MITEYAIIPDVFDASGYSSPEVCDLRICSLRDRLLSQGIVRNIHGGNWWLEFERQRDRWHHRAKELVKKLKQQGRLCDSEACLPDIPVDPITWCQEALASHANLSLQGVVTDDSTAQRFKQYPIIASISRLEQASWWKAGKCSVELLRTFEEYTRVLSPVLRHSNSLMFIDAHLDPCQPRYSGFSTLLSQCGTQKTIPQIELHRVCYTGSGNSRHILSDTECRDMFIGGIGSVVKSHCLNVEVFIWDNFHDRHLISNLMGIAIPNGFDIDSGKPGLTRWTRLDREHRDSVQREFDPASKQHELRYHFKLSTES